MKIALACLVTALITAGGTEAAHRLITSKDIKNGTIQPVDLSTAAKRGMRGAQGPQGPPGIVGMAITSGNTVTLQPGEQGTSTVICPRGRPTGGGWGGVLGPGSVVRAYFYPENGWNVTMENRGTASAFFFAQAVCVY